VGEGLERFGKTFPAGTVLFSEGDDGEEMYVIQSGRVQLTRHVRGREAHLATLPPGEFFGEMAIVNNQPRSATATVLEDAHLLVIDARTFEAMVRGNSEIAMRFIKKMAGRVALANAQVEMLLLADLNHRLTHHLRYLAETQGVADGQVAASLKRLEQARLISMELGTILVAEPGKLDQFLEFLDMKERFGA
jgi:CRP-like cAMP-binding protein